MSSESLRKRHGAFAGYPGLRKDGAVVMDDRKATKQDRARGMADGFKRDYEGMRTSYETYRKPSDPQPAEAAKRLAAADDSAARTVQRTGRDRDNEMTREKRRGQK